MIFEGSYEAKRFQKEDIVLCMTIPYRLLRKLSKNEIQIQSFDHMHTYFT